MTRTIRYLTLGGVAILAAACADTTRSLSSEQLNAAFSTNLLGFESAVSSYNGTGSDSSHAFMPGEGRGHGHGPNGLDIGFDFMGGGFGPDFLGGPTGSGPNGGGRPFDRGGIARSGTCTYAAGVNTCVDTTHGSVIVNSTIRNTNAAGTAQQTADSTTDKVVSHVTTAGSFTRREGTVTTVSSSSDRTVSGLAYNSTQRKVDGTSKGTESSTGKDSAGTFSIVRVSGDTTAGVLIPIVSGKPTYPTAGKVTRQMTATMTRGAAAATTTTRREVVTYDGTATAKLVVTQDGTTKNCTIALPHGRPVCS